MKLKSKCMVMGVAAVVALFTQNSYAGRLFFSNSGPNPGGTVALDMNIIPMATVTPAAPGNTGQLHVWFLPEADENYTGASWNIVTAGNVASIGNSAATGISFTTANPAAAAGGTTRWSGIRNHGINTGTPSPRLVNNAGGFYLPGLSPNPGLQAGNAQDAGYDLITGAFHMGTLNFTGLAAGDVRLYLQVGQNTIARLDGTNNEQIFFGNSQTTAADNDTRNVGDDTASDAAADAIIRVAGGPTPREVILFTDDPNNTGQQFLAPAPANIQPRNFQLTPPANMVQLDARGVQHSFFDVFFDININDDPTLTALAAQLLAQETDDGANFVRVVPEGSNPLGNGIDYDLHIQYTNTPGADRFLDIDASIVPNLLINNIAIPEPSTWALVACGLIGLGLARRRRAA